MTYEATNKAATTTTTASTRNRPERSAAHQAQLPLAVRNGSRVTPGMRSRPIEAICASLRHQALGDWGDVGNEDWAANEDALLNGGRLMSRFVAKDGTVFWVITEADRSVTTVLLPSEY